MWAMPKVHSLHYTVDCIALHIAAMIKREIYFLDKNNIIKYYNKQYYLIVNLQNFISIT